MVFLLCTNTGPPQSHKRRITDVGGNNGASRKLEITLKTQRLDMLQEQKALMSTTSPSLLSAQGERDGCCHRLVTVTALSLHRQIWGMLSP